MDYGEKCILQNLQQKKIKQKLKNIPILSKASKAIFTYFGKSSDEMEKLETKSSDEGYYLGLYNDCLFRK